MEYLEQKFRRDLIISFLLHLIFLSVFIYGLPSVFTKLPEENQVIVFEMLPLADTVNVENRNELVTEDQELKEAQKIKKAAPEPQQEEQFEKKFDEKFLTPEEPKVKEAEPLLEKKVAELSVKEEKKKEEKKPLNPPKEKQEDVKSTLKKPKKTVKNSEDVIDSILKNLEKESEGQETNSRERNNTSKVAKGKFAKGFHNEESPLSITEKLLIIRQIEKNWRPPVGAVNIENVRIILHLKVKTDGVIMEVKIKETICSAGDKQTCDLVADSAVRAAKKASPFTNLRPERYDMWKEFDLKFDPSNIMQ